MPNVKIIENPAEDRQNAIATNSHERDDMQQRIDQQFKELLDRWTAAHRPGPEKSPFVRVTVVKADVGALKAMIRRAATLHKHGVVFYRDQRNPNGSVSVKYVPAPKPAPATQTGQDGKG
jgi:hypothetical protein